MTTTTKQPPCVHDFEPALDEAGILACQWPGCGVRVEASPQPVRGVDVPTDDLVAAVRSARAA